MSTPFLDLNGVRHVLKDLDKVPASTPFEEEVIGFIQDWRNGQESFHQLTSGSTGTPKLIDITRSQMMASAMLTIRALHLPQGGTCLLCLSPNYIAGKMMLVRALLNKMNIVAIEPSGNPFVALNTLIDLAAVIPLQLQHALEQSSDKLQLIKKIIIGGAPVNKTLKRNLQPIATKCYATYGMTETVSHIALQQLNGIERSSYFSVLEGIDINQDERGCLTIEGPVTNNKLVITNDLVNLINYNKFEWLGRIDNVINSGGVKVRSEKVENAVEDIFFVLGLTNRFFITGMADEKLGQQVTLLIEGSLSIHQDTIIDKLEDKLDKYEMPKSIISVPNFVETSSGKVDRKATVKAI